MNENTQAVVEQVIAGEPVVDSFDDIPAFLIPVEGDPEVAAEAFVQDEETAQPTDVELTIH